MTLFSSAAVQRRRFLQSGICSIWATVAVLSTAPMAWAEEDVLLTIMDATGSNPTSFDREALEALPRHEVDAHTSVTDGVHHFEGPLMRDVLAAAHFTGDEVLAIALNDYEVTIPMSDFERFDVIAALEMDGEILTPRDRGPIWIVYPRDDHAELQDIRYDYRWVWQLTRIQAP